MDSGSDDLPTLCSSKNTPSHAASIRSRSRPESARASSNASIMRSSGPEDQRSPKREQPIPAMTTLSLIPLAIV